MADIKATTVSIGFFLCVLLCAASCQNAQGKLRVLEWFLNQDAGKGFAQNCGSVPFNISWHPNPIKPSEKLFVSIDYTFPYEFDGGSYDLTVFEHSSQIPLLELSDDVTCAQIHQKSGGMFPCPISNGKHYLLSDAPMVDVVRLSGYTGDYDVKAIIKNTKKQEMICIYARVIIDKY